MPDFAPELVRLHHFYYARGDISWYHDAPGCAEDARDAATNCLLGPLSSIQSNDKIPLQDVTGPLSGLRLIYKQEGFFALYKGIVPRCMWIGIGGAVFFGAYEESRRVLRRVLNKT